MNGKKLSSIEAAIAAANLGMNDEYNLCKENYVFVKKEDNKSQTPNNSKKVTEPLVSKQTIEEKAKPVPSLTQIPVNKAPKAQTKQSDNQILHDPSKLLSLFQQEISSLLDDSSDNNKINEEKLYQEPPYHSHYSLNIRKQKKTRWDKPIVIPPNFNPVQGFVNVEPVPKIQPSRFTSTPQVVQNTQMQKEEQKQNNTSEKGQMSKSLQDYVRRAFEKCQHEKERQYIEKLLKKIFNQAKLRLEYETRDWSTFPLPLLPRESKGQQLGPLGIPEDEMDIEPIKKKNSQNKEESSFEFGVNENGKKVITTGKAGKSIAFVGLFFLYNRQEMSKEEEEKKKLRQGRFHEDFHKKVDPKFEPYKPSKVLELEAVEGDDFDTLAEKWNVVGTSTALEKPYLRLTREPDPSTIRPEEVLKKSLKMILDKWANKEANYPYCAEQLRSIRQDLNVQHIKNKFTVKVYECNARLSLESQDITHYNQCQARLKDFYNMGLPSKSKPLKEFLCYRIIYLSLGEMNVELSQTLEELTAEELDHEYVKFALEVRNSYEIGNVKGFFNFYKNGINLTQSLIDLFIMKLRVWGLKILSKGFGEKLQLSYIADLLAFANEDELRTFIEKSIDGIMTEDKLYLNNKESFKVYNDHPWLKVKSKKYAHIN